MIQTVRQSFKWGLKSVGGLAANIFLLTVWVEYIGLSPAVAIIPNFFIISTGSYIITNTWIFPHGVSPSGFYEHAAQWVGMQSAMLGSKGLNYILYLALIPVVDYRLAWIVGAAATFFVSFTLIKLWWERDHASNRQQKAL
jgi:putative flippase GtrA